MSKTLYAVRCVFSCYRLWPSITPNSSLKELFSSDFLERQNQKNGIFTSSEIFGSGIHYHKFFHGIWISHPVVAFTYSSISVWHTGSTFWSVGYLQFCGKCLIYFLLSFFLKVVFLMNVDINTILCFSSKVFLMFPWTPFLNLWVAKVYPYFGF